VKIETFNIKNRHRSKHTTNAKPRLRGKVYSQMQAMCYKSACRDAMIMG